MKVRYYSAVRQTLREGATKELIGQNMLPFSASLLHPYLDLEGEGGPLHARIVMYASELLSCEGEIAPPFQMNTAMALRSMLMRECKLPLYDIAFPEQLPEQLRTARWELLCEQLAQWSVLSPEQRVNVATLLNKLGLYSATLRYIPDFTPTDIAADEMVALLAAKRANAVFKTSHGRDLGLVEKTLGSVAVLAPGDGQTRLVAAVNLVVHHAKVTKNVMQMQHWAKVAEQEFQYLDIGKHPYDCLYTSYYYRGISFLPYLLGDRTTTVRLLHQAEVHGRALFQDTRIPVILAAENLHPLLETLTNGALWLDERELAMAYASELVEHDPLDPKVHIRLGDLLLSDKQAEKALSSYRKAASLGAPYTGFAWFMQGQCYETLGAPEGACDAYLQSVKVDPLAPVALLRLYNIAGCLQRRALRRWSAERLQWFRQQCKTAADEVVRYKWDE